MSTPAGSPGNTPAAPEAVSAAVDEGVDGDELADANDLRDAAGGFDGGDDLAGRTELPLEADPVDVAEQDAAVPHDDTER